MPTNKRLLSLDGWAILLSLSSSCIDPSGCSESDSLVMESDMTQENYSVGQSQATSEGFFAQAFALIPGLSSFGCRWVCRKVHRTVHRALWQGHII